MQTTYPPTHLTVSPTPPPVVFTRCVQIGQFFDKPGDSKGMQPTENETKELKNHVIIMGYGRGGQLVAQLLSENLIPFVALDASMDKIAEGKVHDLPVYFGDAGGPVGVEVWVRARTLSNSPYNNQRTSPIHPAKHTPLLFL
eukprot:357496-Chlamydomonas_euryale.AAC.2